MMLRNLFSFVRPLESNLIFRTYFEKESSTYTYLLGDSSTKDCVLIDPVLETVERDEEQIKALGMKLRYAMNTHCHADHTTGTGKLKEIFKGDNCRSVIGWKSEAKADIHVKHGDKIKFGHFELQVRETPGHTNGCVTYYLPEQKLAFTGDALFVRGCGRTDFQGGSPAILYDSVWQQIFTMPDDTHLYPGHDYNGRSVTTVEEEKRLNPRLTKTKEEFIELMNNLNLPKPKKIDTAHPANLKCGISD